MVIGRVTGLYGVRGWVRVFSYTEPRDALLAYRACLLRLDGAWRPHQLAEGRRQGKGLVARFSGVEDRDAAAAIVGAEVGVPRASLPATREGEYYWADLEGLQVRHTDGRILGRVAYLLETGAHDVLAVRSTEAGEAGRERLIPFVPGRYVLGVDLERGIIDVDWEWD